MYSPIKDYAIIGNLRSAVLVSTEASIDWAPAPFIDSPSVFARILDDEQGGFWQVLPQGKYTNRQYYVPDTNVVVTEFTTEKGVLEVTDFIPLEQETTFVPAEEDTTFKIHRKIACRSGECGVRMVFCPKFDYARGETALSAIEGGVLAENGAKHGVLASHTPLEVSSDRATAEFTLSEGEIRYLIFRYNAGSVHLDTDDREHHEKELKNTIAFWQTWAQRCDLSSCPPRGKWAEMVTRSALLLKILFFEPIGTVAAAPTTSLPEEMGGVRNWDYRYTWLRDSSFIFQALFKLGYVTEAKTYIRWLINACYSAVGTRGMSDLQILYGLRGERRLDEEILPHLAGYLNSKPVRIGNEAYLQQQWDVYGSVLDMIWQLHMLNGEKIDSSTWSALVAIADHVVRVWREPDEGLWEVRGGKGHFVYSKVMCWVALDRAIRLKEACALEGGDISVWQNERESIRRAIFERGWNERLQSFTQSFDSEHLDASLLLLPSVGFIEGTDQRMLSTIRAIQEHLALKEGFLSRYNSQDGLPGKGGGFLLASFWLVNALVLAGEKKEAEDLFETIIQHANHVGLFSEEIDPDTGEFLGNFPQAYTHIGLINSAFLLHEEEK